MRSDSPDAERRVTGIADEDRRRHRVFGRPIVWLVIWPVVSIAMMAWGFQMEDQLWGSTVFLCGAGLGNAGILGTLVWAFRRREDE